MDEETTKRLLDWNPIKDLLDEYDGIVAVMKEIRQHGQAYSAGGKSYTLASLQTLQARKDEISLELIKIRDQGEKVLQPRTLQVNFR